MQHQPNTARPKPAERPRLKAWLPGAWLTDADLPVAVVTESTLAPLTRLSLVSTGLLSLLGVPGLSADVHYGSLSLGFPGLALPTRWGWCYGWSTNTAFRQVVEVNGKAFA